jgi:hypothetical protein
MIDREQNGTRPDSQAGTSQATTERTSRFVGVGDGFQVEYAGPVIRIWHDPGPNHDPIPGSRCELHVLVRGFQRLRCRRWNLRRAATGALGSRCRYAVQQVLRERGAKVSPVARGLP